MKPLRIFVAHASDLLTDHLPHGDGLVAFELIRRLVERGHELHVVAERAELLMASHPRLHIYRVQVPTGYPETFRRIIYMLRMRRLFKMLDPEANFDVVHQMNPVSAGISLALFGVKQPLVLGPYPPKWPPDADGQAPARAARLRTSARKLVWRAQQCAARAAIVTSPAAMESIVSPQLKENGAFTIPLGVDCAKFLPRATVPARPSILFLANIYVRKGIFTLLDAFELLAKTNDSAILTIGGEGPALDAVIKRVSMMQARDRIVLLGPVQRHQVGELMRSHSVYCLPSYGEPVSITILEAMACGVPVVATSAGGPLYLVSKDGGRLADPRDASGLAKALAEVLESRSLQESMGRFNRCRVEREFDWERVVDGFERVYRWVLDDSSSPKPEVMGFPVAFPVEKVHGRR